MTARRHIPTQDETELDMTPMLDIIFILLIFSLGCGGSIFCGSNFLFLGDFVGFATECHTFGAGLFLSWEDFFVSPSNSKRKGSSRRSMFSLFSMIYQ